MSLTKKVVIRLTSEQREALGKLVRTGTHPAALRRRAQILLKSDSNGPDRWPDERIAEALEISRMTVMRVRQQLAAEGLDATLHRKRPTGRQYRKLDGRQEAQLVALACSAAPEGRARWTMVLLADKLAEMQVVDSIDPATVWRTLKKQPQALAQAAVGHPAESQRAVRSGYGGRAGGLFPPLRSGASGGVRG
jgi:transposase